MGGREESENPKWKMVLVSPPVFLRKKLQKITGARAIEDSFEMHAGAWVSFACIDILWKCVFVSLMARNIRSTTDAAVSCCATASSAVSAAIASSRAMVCVCSRTRSTCVCVCSRAHVCICVSLTARNRRSNLLQRSSILGGWRCNSEFVRHDVLHLTGLCCFNL